MNDRQLKYILTVAETRNISAAARQLFISQPSLSAMILSIEEELGTPLFDRSTTPLSLTYAGECYVEAAREILSIERDMLRKIQETSETVRGPLSVGCSSATSSLIMSFLIPKFLRRYPEVRLQIIEDHAPELGKYLQSGEADVLCTPALLNEATFHKKVLSHEDVILLAPPFFRPKSLREIPGKPFPVYDGSELNGMPFALMKIGHMTRELQDQVLREESISPQVLLETERWETCLSMVENNLAFTLLPYSKLKKDVFQGKIRAFSTHADVYREVCLYWRKNALLPQVTKTFLAFTEEEFAAL
ncbi:MAG: LysR family transcriptional regulator [Lachnospiraceae bacterium]|nr:LysR family transcriptional regulator [Lachnospiraceae bacterium]MBR0153137.1 LysR family transcriptional regulator [Lachnospiraceae bacterium]